jgi:radical SAM superfamily enzyme YgiQ (UPF0313 family)
MKVLMVNTNRNQFPVTVLPHGACMVAQSAERTGHTVRMLDLMFEKNVENAVNKAFKDFTPDIVGLSIRNIDNNDMQNPVLYPKELDPIVEAIKRVTSVPIVLGGAAIGIMPEEFLRRTGASWAVMGSGENVFPELLLALEQDESPKHLSGLAWIENDQFRENSICNTLQCESYPLPDFRRWLNMRKYKSRLSTIPIQSKRGCPFDCIYCTYAMSEGPSHQVYSPQSVANAIQDCVAQGFRDIEFVDNVFNAPYEHAIALCEQLSAMKTRARLQSLELNPRYIDDALLTAMEKAGFVGIGITPESVSDPVLANLQKGFTAEDVYRAAECVRRHKLPCVWIFMLGGPGENAASIEQTLDFASKHIHPRDIAFFNIGIRIYPGTKLEKIAREQKILTKPAKNMLDPIFYVSPDIYVPWLMKKLEAAMVNHHNFLISTSLSHPLVPLIYQMAFRLGVSPPIWKHTRVLRRTLRFFGLNV